MLSTELASDPPLRAEDREANAKRERLPVATELLSTRGTGKGGTTVS